MRNVPPTPANYAQRSGRAGRVGPARAGDHATAPPATATTSTTSAARERMVAGAVAPPRLDLANEDLVRSHVQAIWLAETGLRLGRAIPDVIDISYDEDVRQPRSDAGLHDHVRDAINDPAAQRRAIDVARRRLRRPAARVRADHVVGRAWIEDRCRSAPQRFDARFNRWRDLFRAALVDQAEQNRRVAGPHPHRGRPPPRGEPAPGGGDPAQPVEERERGQQVGAGGLQPVPVLGVRGVPARVLVPPAAAGRVRPDAGPPVGAGRRLPAAAPVPRRSGSSARAR